MNPDGTMDLLSQLRDIQGAPPVPFWPPAPGWWLLAAVLLLLLAWGVRRLMLRRRAGQRRKVLQQQLTTLRVVHDPVEEPQAWLAAVNRLLKVAAMRAYPEASPGTLQGAAWTAFLAGAAAQGAPPEESGALNNDPARAADDTAHDPGPFAALAAGPYQPHPNFDAAALEGAASEWLSRHG